ncbi:MAG: hypothetical protein K9L74_05765 [Candidatus Izimaplasma sp.]|nr:hypothetical protein [Candidatus Izimaplasma bacterium]
MKFEWTSKKPKLGIATLYDSNITLNKAASSHFENAYKVLLGLDDENMKLAIKPVSKEDHDIGAIAKDKEHNITVKQSYARVCNKRFMSEVANLTGINLTKATSHKYKATWDNDEKILIIDLKTPEV